MKHPLDPLLGFHLVRTANMALRTLNDSYGDLGIRHTDAAILLVVAANPGITQSNIGKLLNIQRSNVATMASRLFERGWLERRPGKGKTIGMYMTDEGQRIMPDVQRASQDTEDFLTEALGIETYRSILEALRRVR